MAVTGNKPISRVKEMFLALCLLSGEISQDTVKAIKADYGNDYIRKDIVYYLTSHEYIKKIGSRKDYGFILTKKGHDYIRIKCPNKYNYEVYSYSKAFGTSEGLRYKCRKISEMLYSLVKQGISIENHQEDFLSILRGETVNVVKPFFVSSKECKYNIRIRSQFSSRFYGCIVSSEKIIIIYAPDEDHRLSFVTEDNMCKTLFSILDDVPAPYNKRANISVMYYYPNVETARKSFETNITQVSNKNTSTRRFYSKNIYIKNYMYIEGHNFYDLSSILDNGLSEKIDNAFKDFFCVKNAVLTPDTLFSDGLYEEHLNTVVIWDMNPKKISQVINYMSKENEKCVLCCFTEQKDMLDEIISINKKARSKSLVAHLHKQSVNDYINGIIDIDDLE